MKWILTSILTAVLVGGGAAADQIYLSADFEDQDADATIGQGGALVGEPVSVDPMITATVRTAPMPTLSLEVQDNDDYSAGYVCFEFEGSAEVTSGQLTVAAELLFQELDDYSVLVREQGSSAEAFMNLRFHSDGTMSLSNAAGATPYAGTYDVGHVYPVVFRFDMDAGTYDFWFNRQLQQEGQPHGVSSRGVGSVLFGCEHDADLAGTFNVDNILVSNGFTPVDATTWGKIKAQFAH